MKEVEKKSEEKKSSQIKIETALLENSGQIFRQREKRGEKQGVERGLA